MAEYNPIFEKIFDRVGEPGDEIIAYIAYGLYKQRKRDFLISRRKELGGPVPQEELEIFHRTYDDGQIQLVWDAANESLATFAVNYADEEKKTAVREALSDALKGRFWKQVGMTAAANFVFAVGIIAIYFMLRFIGFDLLDRLRALDRMFQGG
ncbi:hypothetical protein HW532_15010 [Kaustia mangrovi]|uniref:Uncharacterized protein n=1 Tax=Kaustia mangrovi TaxID=2593653 RepID=A0A7S8C5S5_9HYPH|nr:hypothetical protein [Kaustia mangrovi]QPC43882.1 hypothetical protein HW532_15010 [Kaustia mangrovi]